MTDASENGYCLPDGDAFKEARKNRGWRSIRVAAEETGLARGTIGNIERGDRVRLRTALLYAKALRLPRVPRNDSPRAKRPPDVETLYGRFVASVYDRSTAAGVWGGRQNELGRLADWLSSDRRFFLLTGPGGVGKSSLLSHWVEPMPRKAIVVLPIGVRWNTHRQTQAYARLLEDLVAAQHQVPRARRDRTDANTEALVTEELERAAARCGDGPFLIVLDGIDETSGWRWPDWFFHKLPRNVKVIASARSRPHGDSIAYWRRHLGWQEKESDAYELTPLDFAGVAEIARARFAGGAYPPSVITAHLWKATRGDPLRLGLYVAWLLTLPADEQRREIDNLPESPPRIGDVIAKWMDDQTEMWGLPGDPLISGTGLAHALCAALASAQGPVPLDQLIAVLSMDPRYSGHAAPHPIRQTARHLARVILGGSETLGYWFAHDQIREYFRREFKDELAMWNERYLEFARREIAAAARDGRSTHVSQYVLAHYAAHVNDPVSSPDPRDCKHLLSRAWRDKKWMDPAGLQEWRDDIAVIHSRLHSFFRDDLALGGDLLPWFVTAGTLTALGAGIADRLTPDLVRAAVGSGVWDLETATAHVREANPRDRLYMLAALVERLHGSERDYAIAEYTAEATTCRNGKRLALAARLGWDFLDNTDLIAILRGGLERRPYAWYDWNVCLSQAQPSSRSELAELAELVIRHAIVQDREGHSLDVWPEWLPFMKEASISIVLIPWLFDELTEDRRSFVLKDVLPHLPTLASRLAAASIERISVSQDRTTAVTLKACVPHLGRRAAAARLSLLDSLQDGDFLAEMVAIFAVNISLNSVPRLYDRYLTRAVVSEHWLRAALAILERLPKQASARHRLMLDVREQYGQQTDPETRLSWALSLVEAGLENIADDRDTLWKLTGRLRSRLDRLAKRLELLALGVAPSTPRVRSILLRSISARSISRATLVIIGEALPRLPKELLDPLLRRSAQVLEQVDWDIHFFANFMYLASSAYEHLQDRTLLDAAWNRLERVEEPEDREEGLAEMSRYLVFLPVRSRELCIYRLAASRRHWRALVRWSGTLTDSERQALVMQLLEVDPPLYIDADDLTPQLIELFAQNVSPWKQDYLTNGRNAGGILTWRWLLAELGGELTSSHFDAAVQHVEMDDLPAHERSKCLSSLATRSRGNAAKVAARQAIAFAMHLKPSPDLEKQLLSASIEFGGESSTQLVTKCIQRMSGEALLSLEDGLIAQLSLDSARTLVNVLCSMDHKGHQVICRQLAQHLPPEDLDPLVEREIDYARTYKEHLHPSLVKAIAERRPDLLMTCLDAIPEEDLGSVVCESWPAADDSLKERLWAIVRGMHGSMKLRTICSLLPKLDEQWVKRACRVLISEPKWGRDNRSRFRDAIERMSPHLVTSLEPVLEKMARVGTYAWILATFLSVVEVGRWSNRLRELEQLVAGVRHPYIRMHVIAALYQHANARERAALVPEFFRACRAEPEDTHWEWPDVLATCADEQFLEACEPVELRKLESVARGRPGKATDLLVRCLLRTESPDAYRSVIWMLEEFPDAAMRVMDELRPAFRADKKRSVGSGDVQDLAAAMMPYVPDCDRQLLCEYCSRQSPRFSSFLLAAARWAPPEARGLVEEFIAEEDDPAVHSSLVAGLAINTGDTSRAKAAVAQWQRHLSSDELRDLTAVACKGSSLAMKRVFFADCLERAGDYTEPARYIAHLRCLLSLVVELTGETAVEAIVRTVCEAICEHVDPGSRDCSMTDSN